MASILGPCLMLCCSSNFRQPTHALNCYRRTGKFKSIANDRISSRPAVLRHFKGRPPSRLDSIVEPSVGQEIMTRMLPALVRRFNWTYGTAACSGTYCRIRIWGPGATLDTTTETVEAERRWDGRRRLTGLGQIATTRAIDKTSHQATPIARSPTLRLYPEY